MPEFAHSEDFPEECPPDDATEVEEERVLRLVRNTPPTIEDFVPLVIERPGRNFGNLLCQACGLSIYKNLEDVHRLQRRVGGHRDKPIAAGRIVPELGVVKPTPNRHADTHTTWWLYRGVDPSPLFEVDPELALAMDEEEGE